MHVDEKRIEVFADNFAIPLYDNRMEFASFSKRARVYSRSFLNAKEGDKMNNSFRRATIEDLPMIVDIYNSTIASRMVTADTEPVTVEDRMDWYLRHNEKRPLYVMQDAENNICGWLSFETFYGRPAYNKTAEISIYIHEKYRGQGLGSQFVEEALSLAPSLGIRSIMAFIFGHNKPSIKLFEKFGFQKWGHMPGIAEMDEQRYDLVILGIELE